MRGFKSLALCSCLLAIVLPLCLNWTEAQKTSANSFQQQIGSNPESVYGGYQTQQSSFNRKQSSLVSPVNQRRDQPVYSSNRQQSSSSSSFTRTQQQQQQRQPAYQQQKIQSSSSSSYEQSQQAEADAEPASYGAVQGQPGVDFPAYTQVPKTSFSCDGLPYDYGMYADEETGCQAYHVCYNGRKDSFLCGVGTVFNQRILHCDYWYSVECGKSSQYYSSNAYMGSSQPEPGPAQAQSPVQQNSYKRTESVSSSSINRPTNVQRVASASSSYKNTQQQQVQEDGY